MNGRARPIWHRGTGWRRVGWPGFLLFLLATQVLAVTPGSYLKQYTSSVDGSLQPYGLYIPTPYMAADAHPVIFSCHGFSGRASGAFGTYQQQFANAHGFLLVQLDGRGNTFYDGVGEVDFFEVLQDLRAHYRLDERRLYIEGASMGATGAYRLGMRYPDIFAAAGGADGWADYRYWHRHWYAPARDPYEVAPYRLANLQMASCVDVAAGAMWANLYMIVDTNDENVWPENTYNLNTRLNALGAATPETDYRHVMETNPGGGHCAGYNQATLYTHFLMQTRPVTPKRVAVNTTRLKYGRAHWLRIDRMETVNTFASGDATVAGSAVSVTLSNVSQYTLLLDTAVTEGASEVTVTTNGVPSYAGPVGTITLYARHDDLGDITGWSTTDETLGGLRKVAGLEGPIGDAYTSTFIVVYGTAGSDAETTANQAEAETFCQHWNTWMHAGIVARPDTGVTASDIAAANLILFGTADSNRLIRTIQPDLPIAVGRDGIGLGGRTYTGTHYGAYFVYPNPANPSRYVVISHLTVPGSRPKDLEALPWYWPDYVVFDTTRSPGACVQASLAYLPDTFVEAGYFNGAWQLPAAHRPDMMIRAAGDSAFRGNDTYHAADAGTATRTVASGVTASYILRVQNDGSVDDTYALTGPGSTADLSIRYIDLATMTDITEALTGPEGWPITLSPRATHDIRLDVVLGPAVAGQVAQVVAVVATATADATVSDTVSAATVRTALSGVSLAPSLVSPVVPGIPVTLTATPADGGPVLYWFRAQNGTGWVDLQGYSAANTCKWTPQVPGTYTLQVLAKDAHSTKLYDVYRVIAYVVKPPISTLSLTAMPAAPTAVGCPIRLTATSTGGARVRYSMRIFDGTHWTTLLPYGTATACTWTPTTAGMYTLQVLAMNADSLSPPDATYEVAYQVAMPVTAVTLTTSPRTPVGIGTPVTLTAKPQGGGTLLYWFRVQRGTTWTSLQAYETGNTCQWTPPAAGSYTLQVLVKEAASRRSYDVYAVSRFVAVSPPQ